MTHRSFFLSRRAASVAGVGLAVLVIAAPVSRHVKQLLMLGLFTVMWLALLVSDRILRSGGRSSGLGRYVVGIGTALVILASLVMFDR